MRSGKKTHYKGYSKSLSSASVQCELSLSAIRLISPTPIDDLLKLSSHPGFPVNANSSSQHAQLKANKVLGNHYSCK